MTRNDLAQMSRDELSDLVLELHAEVEALRLKLEKGKKPPTNSSNSSQPPWRDHKPNGPKGRGKRRHGPPQGHPKNERKMVTKADHIVNLKAEVCANCHADLQAVTGHLLAVNQITELPDPKAESQL